MRREPFDKETQRAWYLEIGRKQVRLGNNNVEPFMQYRRLMAYHKAEKFGAKVRLLLVPLQTLRQIHRRNSLGMLRLLLGAVLGMR